MVSVLCALAICLHVYMYMYGGHGTVHCSTDGLLLYALSVHEIRSKKCE